MEISAFDHSLTTDVIELFTAVFSDAENEDEGRAIGELVANLVATTEPADICGFVATDAGQLHGSIFFTRLWLPDHSHAFILSPVAVATAKQGRGIAQQLIRHGLGYLRAQGVERVFTYGDPHYYSRLGFEPIPESVVKAPCRLSQPEGWLAQSLDGRAIQPMSGAARCVGALDNPQYW